jgi:hypothetical protein
MSVLAVVGSLAPCSAPRLLSLFFFGGAVNYVDDDTGESLSFLAVVACVTCIGGLWYPLDRRTRFSRLLRRHSDPRTATVTALKRGGHTVMLDIPRDGTGRGYQSLSEVRLALRTKADMLVPGETVTSMGRPANGATC